MKGCSNGHIITKKQIQTKLFSLSDWQKCKNLIILSICKDKGITLVDMNWCNFQADNLAVFFKTKNKYNLAAITLHTRTAS